MAASRFAPHAYKGEEGEDHRIGGGVSDFIGTLHREVKVLCAGGTDIQYVEQSLQCLHAVSFN